MADTFDEAAVTEALVDLPEWRLEDGALARTHAFNDFPGAIAGVAGVAAVAEAAAHHPDIDIRWRTVTFRCSTHSAGGITAADVELAHAIDDLLADG